MISPFLYFAEGPKISKYTPGGGYIIKYRKLVLLLGSKLHTGSIHYITWSGEDSCMHTTEFYVKAMK